MLKSAVSCPRALAPELLQRVAAGQGPDSVAQQMGRTPQTIRGWIAAVRIEPPAPPPQPTMAQRALAWRNRLVAALLSPRESRYAARASAELLKLYWIVLAGNRALPRREIYRRVVMARTGADADDAEAVLLRAEHSFARWPTVRELTFSDVVHYLVVTEYLALDGAIGTRTHMGGLVAGWIPQSL